jgi:hypothetical protein
LIPDRSQPLNGEVGGRHGRFASGDSEYSDCIRPALSGFP